MGIFDIQFEGLATPVRTVNCESLIEGLPGYVPRWPFVVREMTPAVYGPEEPAATLAFNGTGWLIQSPHTEAPRVHRTEVNVACDLVSILASALIAETPEMLCFHAAAVERDGALTLFPALRRAGKSTVAAAMMARGARLFTDDFLPVAVGGDGPLIGRATGIAARLRMPLPAALPDKVRAYVTSNAGPENAQYAYVGGAEVANHGTVAPICRVILLDRQDGGAAEIRPVTEGEALARLAKQNFSRGLPAGEALSALIRLVRTAPAMVLSYSDLDEAADLIDRSLHFSERADVAVPEFPGPGEAPDTAPFDPDQAYQATDFAVLHPAGDVWVGASHDGTRMLQFDQAAVAVLDVIREGMTPRDVADLITEVRGEGDRTAIHDSTFAILQQFLKVGYIARSDI